MISFKKHKPDELKTIVHDYQKGDTNAAELLRQQFSPLIYKLSHRHSMLTSFGEDAENMAWLLFYEFIASYQGNDFIHLPGLVKRFVIFRLMNIFEHNSIRFNLEQLDEFNHDSSLTQIASSETLDNTVDKVIVEQILKDLPSQQHRVLEELYLQDKTQEQVATTLCCTTRYIRKCKNLGLKNIKKKLHSS